MEETQELCQVGTGEGGVRLRRDADHLARQKKMVAHISTKRISDPGFLDRASKILTSFVVPATTPSKEVDDDAPLDPPRRGCHDRCRSYRCDPSPRGHGHHSTHHKVRAALRAASAPHVAPHARGGAPTTSLHGACVGRCLLEVGWIPVELEPRLLGVRTHAPAHEESDRASSVRGSRLAPPAPGRPHRALPRAMSLSPPAHAFARARWPPRACTGRQTSHPALSRVSRPSRDARRPRARPS